MLCTLFPLVIEDARGDALSVPPAMWLVHSQVPLSVGSPRASSLLWPRGSSAQCVRGPRADRAFLLPTGCSHIVMSCFGQYPGKLLCPEVHVANQELCISRALAGAAGNCQDSGWSWWALNAQHMFCRKVFWGFRNIRTQRRNVEWLWLG